jgi:HK97 family phage major capsid protein/HK97 family phage prohead protease
MKNPKPAEMVKRAAVLDRAKVDEKARTCEVCFSSEAPVERWFGFETLSHAPGAMQLGRLNSGAAVLWNHDSDAMIGVVERATCDEDRKGRAVLRFGSSAKAEEIWKDVQSGIIRNVSVGYCFEEMKLVSESGGVKSYRIDSWEPLEISLVSIPADTSVGVGRSEDNQPEQAAAPANPAGEPDTMKLNRNFAPDGAGGGPAPVTIDIVSENRKAVDAERTRTKEIFALGAAHNMREAAQTFAAEGKSVEEFRDEVLKSYRAKPAPSPEIGMSPKEVKQYRILKAINEVAANGPGGLTGLEREAHDAAAKLYGREVRGFLVPHDIAIRELNATTPSAGGYLVGTDVLVGSMIELLRNKTVVAGMGTTMLDGLTGNVAIPRSTGGATAYWVAESGAPTNSTQAFGQVALTPKQLAAETRYTKQLVAQTSLGVEAFVRNDIARVLAIALDLAALHGTGNAGQPLGVFPQAGNTVTFSGAATWAKVLSFESEIATDNAERGALGWITTPAVRAKWKSLVRFSSTASPIWTDENTINGYRAEVTNQVSTGLIIFGNWNDLVMASWAGIDVVVDPYTLASNSQIKIVVNQMADIAVRNANSFCKSTDTAAA